jgi:hypothetical protein
MRTIQLWRYTLIDGEYDAFVAWWQDAMPRVRPPAGFTIDFSGVPQRVAEYNVGFVGERFA